MKGKLKANADVAGGGVGVLVAWGWNGLMPDYQMDATVGIPAAILVGRVIRYAAAWLPDPHGDDGATSQPPTPEAEPTK